MPITINKARVPASGPIAEAAARMEPRMRQAFLDAVRAVRDQLILSKLEEALRAGDANQALAVLAIDKRFVDALQGVGLEAGVKSFKDAIADSFRAGAEAAALQLPARVSLALSFDLLNPHAVDFLRSYSFNLIQQISHEQRAAVQDVLIRAFTLGGHPYDQAREIKQFIGLTTRMERAVANYRAALERGGSSLRDALARALRDGRYDRSLLRALQAGEGLKPDYIDKLVARYRERYLQYRARNIARTETIRASVQGQRELWRQAVEQGLIPHTAKRKWVTADDDRVCPLCESLDGEVRGLDEAFSEGIMDPPDTHPSCRCTCVLVASSLKAAA